MCGIIAAISKYNIIPQLLNGLSHLEYRGYDSTGMAILNPSLKRIRSTGRITNLTPLCENYKSNIGIAHTRWATHGKPNTNNSHPHISHNIAIVHNGIIENYLELKQFLITENYTFESDTDTETIAHLLHYNLEFYSYETAVYKTVNQLQGSYAIAIINEQLPDTLTLIKNGSPLLLGLTDTTIYAASDAAAVIEYTNKLIYLENNDIAFITNNNYKIYNDNIEVSRPITISDLNPNSITLGKYNHYMQKEIFEQPKAITDTLEIAYNITPHLFGTEIELLNNISQILILACGTSYYAGLIAKHWLEEIAGIPTNVEIASEYRYRKSIPDPNQLIITISQSGETADTIAALLHAKTQHSKTLSICNVPESTLVRESNLKFITRAGPEIGVASTKAFTTQLTALFLLTLTLSDSNYLLDLKHIPLLANQVLELEPKIIKWAKLLVNKSNIIFLGRGIHYPIALEGALKLKEITYINANAYPAGELKHGPLALLDNNTAVIVLAPDNHLLDKINSNIEEVKARDSETFILTNLPSNDAHSIVIPKCMDYLSPILFVITLQLLAYHVALLKGTDVDKPRNLAKSVTVE